ncbi:MAG: glycoside hydrolase family 15 protein [Caulobacteraceae bacterium]
MLLRPPTCRSRGVRRGDGAGGLLRVLALLIARGTVNGPWAKLIKRSLITLKALTYAPTGGLVAAPTASLPEQFGGVRNWDYRYCWIRDATLTLLALMNAGYYGEAKAWRDWLLRAAAGAPEELQIMYGIGGERRADGMVADLAPRLSGRSSRADRQRRARAVPARRLRRTGRRPIPARCGGLESDIDARAMVGILRSTSATSGKSLTRASGRAAAGPALHLSKVMAWVAVDRAVKSVEQFGVPGAADDWRALRDRIHADICARWVRPGQETASCRPMAARRWTPACCRSPRWGSSRPTTAVHRHGAGDRARAALRRLRHALRHRRDRGRPARGRERLPGLQLLAGGRLRPDGAARRRPAACSGGWPRCATTWACWPRSTTRPRSPRRQLPPGLLPRRPDQRRLQPDPLRQADRAAGRLGRAAGDAPP